METINNYTFCEDKECINYSFIRATVNRPCIGLVLHLPNILRDCKENCPYFPNDFFNWYQEKLIKKLGLKI